MTVFVLADGDGIGTEVERLILGGEVETLRRFSRAVRKGVDAASMLVRDELRADVLVAGGDDLLFRVAADRYRRDTLEEMAARFLRMSGRTLSVGVGNSLEQALLALRTAKSRGGGMIVERN